MPEAFVLPIVAWLNEALVASPQSLETALSSMVAYPIATDLPDKSMGGGG